MKLFAFVATAATARRVEERVPGPYPARVLQPVPGYV